MANPSDTAPNLVAKISDPATRLTTLRVDYVTADVIGVTYDMMPGARPEDMGALLGIWQDQNQIPWEDPPFRTKEIGKQQHGSVAFDDLSVQKNSYIIGLYAGPRKTDAQKNRNVVAQVFIAGVDGPYEPRHDFVTLKFVGPTSVAVQFNCLTGFRAATDLAWMGLWRGEQAHYTKPPDVGATKISIDSDFGTVAFNNVSIGVGLTYTVGFFPTGWDSDAAKRNQNVLTCSLTFTNA